MLLENSFPTAKRTDVNQDGSHPEGGEARRGTLRQTDVITAVNGNAPAA